MSDYSQTTDFSVKDALTTGDPNKVIFGAHVDDELAAISTAITSKANKVSAPTADHVASLTSSGDLKSTGRYHPGSDTGLSGGKLTPATFLEVLQTGVTSVQVLADTVKVQSTTGDFVDLSTVDVTATITTSGANGLDTGSEAASTWYYVWVIYNGTTTSSLLSLSNSAPTMPSGYTYKGLVGVVRNNASSDLIVVRQFGNFAMYSDADFSVLSAGTATIMTDVDLSTLVPPISRVAYLACTLLISHGTAEVSFNMSIRRKGDTGAGRAVIAAISQVVNIDIDNRVALQSPCSSAQVIQYKLNSAPATGGGYMNVTGYLL